MDNSYILYHLPLSEYVIQEIQNILAHHDVLVTSGTNASMPYRVSDYLHPSITVHTYIDRNVLSYVLALQKEEPRISIADEYKIAAACMCFLNLINAEIEPNVALYELGNNNRPIVAYNEYLKYIIAINVSPVTYANIALGFATNISLKEIESIRSDIKDIILPEKEFSKRLRYWKSSYLCMLQAACMMRKYDKSILTAYAYLDWMANEFYLHQVELCFVLVGLSSGSPGILRGFKSNNIYKLRNAIMRASWDVVYLRFLQHKARITGEYQVNMLCTRDGPLRVYAQNTLFMASDNDNTDELEKLLKLYWGSNAGSLCRHARECEKVVYRPNRKTEVETRRNNIDVMIVAREGELGITINNEL